MTASLIVVPHRGDELALFGALLPSLGLWEAASLHSATRAGTPMSFAEWDDALGDLGGRAVDLGLPDIDPALIDLAHVLPRLARRLDAYATICVPCPGLAGDAGVVAAVVAAALKDGDRLLTLAGGAGLAETVHRMDAEAQRRGFACLDRHYRALCEAEAQIQTPVAACLGLRRAPARDVLQFALHFGPVVTDYCAWYDALAGEFDDPWGMADSAYERRRHAMELDLLGKSPGAIAEIGACTGIQTRRLIARFGQAALTCIEPHAGFAERLRDLGVRVLEQPAHRVCEAFDTLVFSCCLYDMRCWPLRLIEAARRFVLTSHGPRYEREIVVPAMRSLGFAVRATMSLAPATESFKGVPITREGALMHLWARG